MSFSSFITTPMETLQAYTRGDFLSFPSFKLLGSKLSNIDDFTYKGDIYQYEKIKEIEDILAAHLRSRPDKDEIISIAAVQVGLLYPVIYMEYPTASKKGNKKLKLLLTDPEIEPMDMDNPELFIKLVKCPNSPTPYHIGLFNKNILITSTNRESFAIPFDSPLFGNRGEMSAALQRAGWANQGYVPGDKSEIPMNYYRICELIGVDSRFRESFNCVIHRDEIEYIISKLNRIKSTDTNNEETNLFKYNLMSLLSSESIEPWLRVPAINLFENGKKLFLN
jgi:hypothetical protein